MIGANLPHHILSADDARAYAAAIAALRAEEERIETMFKPDIDALTAGLKRFRDSRDTATAPFTKRADELRKVLADWLAGDPDGNLRDGDRIVATLARSVGKPVVDSAKLPDEYKSLQPDMAKINSALLRGVAVPGVVEPVKMSLRVLT